MVDTSGDDLPYISGMRLRSRVLLVVLTWAVLLGASAALVFPGLDAGILDVNPLAVVLGGVWLVLLVALLIQVSHRWRPVVIGIIFMALVLLPGFVTMGVLSGYGQFAMQRSEATVVEARSRGSQPPSVLFELEDGSRDRGYSTAMSPRPHSSYIVPAPGTRATVLTDPAGVLPPRTAGADEATDAGRVEGVALTLPSLVGLALLAVATVSVLTRRESFVTRTAREEEARRVAGRQTGT